MNDLMMLTKLSVCSLKSSRNGLDLRRGRRLAIGGRIPGHAIIDTPRIRSIAVGNFGARAVSLVGRRI